METEELWKIVNKLWPEAVRMVYEGKNGRPGPVLSAADTATTLYFDVMWVDLGDPHWPDRDRSIPSKGHTYPIWHTALNECGYSQPKAEHFHLRGFHSMFQGHPPMKNTPGIDMTSGSSGNGIAIGAGMALVAKITNRSYYTYVICGDGELQEDACWEGASVATGQGLDNLIVFVDRNGWQSYKKIKRIIGINNPADRFHASGWHVQGVCGHDIEAIQTAVAIAKSTKGCPSRIVCDCVKGKGVSYTENNSAWHKGMSTDEEYELAVKKLGVPTDD